MKQPDRFDKMAGHMTYTRESLARNIAKLLRAEHRAVVRLVKQQTILAGGMLDRGVLIEALKEGTR
jgi:2-keto-3-deoxy-L-rhamnonate aldolase RhmA